MIWALLVQGGRVRCSFGVRLVCWTSSPAVRQQVWHAPTDHWWTTVWVYCPNCWTGKKITFPGTAPRAEHSGGQEQGPGKAGGKGREWAQAQEQAYT